MSVRRNPRLANLLSRRSRSLRLEPLECRTLLSATPTDDSFQLAIYTESSEVEIPAEVGVQSDDSTESLFTVDDSGEIYMDSTSDLTLGDFFDIWQNNAGEAGNQADAVLAEDQLMGYVENGESTVQMFVNGQVSTEFDEYVVQDGDEIVLVYGDNPVVSLNTNYGPIVIELYAEDTPGTVENFLNYVNDGDYLNSIFHRSVEDFVIQGGGYTTPSTTLTAVSQFDDVPEDDPITNEPGLSNVRGTIAMAKLSGDVDSATSQFFVNLSDDNVFLDSEDYGEFTVFGQILDMTTVDEISNLTIDTSNSSPFGELPLGEDGEGETNQLVVVQSITGQGEISGVKYLDADADGEYDDGEELLAGVTVYLDADDDGVLDSDETWTVTDSDGAYFFQVEAGDYVVRSEVTPGYLATGPLDPDSYSVTVEIGVETSDLNFGEIALSAPSGVDLVADYDTGDADDDDLTNNNNSDSSTVLQFLVSGVTSGAEIQLFAGDTMIGNEIATGDTVTITTDGVQALADGTYDITAVQVLGGTTDPSDALVLTIDATGPSGLTNTAPDTAQVGVAYSFDAESSEEGDIVYSLVDAPDGMTIDASTGEIAWTPTSDQAVPQSFQIALTDEAGNTTTEDIAITVLGVIPAYPDSYSTDEDATLTVSVDEGVLANDDTESGTLSVAVYDTPSHGSVTLGSNGSFVYIPNVDFSGTDTFSYFATNTEGDESNVALVTITVNPVNDAPEGTADSYTTSEDTTLTKAASSGVLANDSDPDGDDITATLVDQASHGTVTLSSDGSFTYVPDDDYYGTDSFTYKINDGTDDSEDITVSLTVTAVNDAPAAEADAYTVDEDETLTVTAASGVLANDSDAEDDTLTATLVSNPSNGSVSLSSDGSFVYTPDDDFYGTDTFTYTASDGEDTSETTTVTITVSAQPDAPTAVADTAEAPNDGSSVLIDVLDNDTSDPDGTQALTITSVTQGSLGATVVIEDDQIRFTAAAGTEGTETFTYTITDSDGLTSTATVTVTVAEAGDNTLSGYVYIDVDGDGARDSGEIGVPGVLITLTGTDNFGNSVSLNALTDDDGAYRFEGLWSGTYQLSERQPTALADGADSSSVEDAEVSDDVISSLAVSDSEVYGENNFGEAGLHPEYISIRMFLASAPPLEEYLRDVVANAEDGAGYDDLADAIRNGDTEYDDGENDAPTVVSNSYSVDEGDTLTVDASSGVLANDSDADGDSLTASLVSDVSHGTLTFNADGSFTYVPDDDYNGTDTFTYLANDGLADSATATVTITVNSVNDAPVATADSYDAAEDTTLTVGTASGVLANDTDADDDSLTATLVSDVSNGTLTLNSDGSFAYVPDSGFNGTDTFTYTANDGTDDSDAVTVTITVSAVPEAEDDSYSTDEDEVLTVDVDSGVLANDSDADGDTLTASIVTQPSNGTVTLSSSGAFVYTPDTDFYGTDTFTYVANDGTHDSAEATVTITVSAVNDVPETAADSYDTIVDATLIVDADEGVLANDTDGDGDSLTVTLVSDVSNGTLTFSSDGSFTYVPDSGFNGTDTFTYTASDGTDDSAETTVTITVNALPATVDDAYSVDEDTTLTISTASGVLANDSDADGDDLSVTVVTEPTHGTLTLSTDGSFTYEPADDYYGTDTFTYVANDGTNDSAEATVTITINAVEDAPDAVADSYSVPVNGQLTVTDELGVLVNDADADGDAITAVVVTEPSNGTLTLNSDGSFSYTPDADFYGTDTFTYVANDGSNDSTETTVTIIVDSAASVLDDEYSVTRNESLVVATASGVAANDSDPDGDSFTVSVATEPSNGTLSLNADGSFTYVPDTDFYGTDTFTYVANDGLLDSFEATVTIEVNVLPDVADDSYTVDEDDTLTVDADSGVLANDSDTDDTSLTVAVVTEPSYGTLTLNADGSFEYTPNADYNGTDSFTYVANDGTDDSEEATVTITVAAVDDAPVAAGDVYSVALDTTLTVSASNGVLVNDQDADGDSLTVTLSDTTSYGTLSLASDGSFTYTPNSGFHGDDTFTYTASDGTNESAVTTVTINVNTAPDALSDSYSVDEDGELTVDDASGVLANDSDDDSDALTATLTMEPSNGTLTFNSDGSFVYTPDADFNGTDGFTYVANDGYDDSTETTVVITVNSVNDVAETTADSYTVAVNGSLTVDADAGVAANDTDVDGDSLSVSVSASPSNGSLTLNSDGSFTYTPNTDFHGTDSFTYVANDGTADSAETTVTIQVNTAAAATDDAYSVDEDSTLTVDVASGLLSNDTDTESDSLTVAVATEPTNGALSLAADGSFVYTPDADFSGTDTFTYTVNDGYTDSAEATVTITVNPVNDAPVVVDDSYSVVTNEQLVVSATSGVLANDSDADGDSLTVTLVTGPAHGTLLVSGDGSFQFTPETDYEGSDSFTYTVNDGTEDSATATVSLEIADAVDAAMAAEEDWS